MTAITYFYIWVGIRVFVAALITLIILTGVRMGLTAYHQRSLPRREGLSMSLALLPFGLAILWVAFQIGSATIQQLSWAKEYDVGPGEFPAFIRDFPDLYLEQRLASGMTRAEVHSIVRGYVSVGNCSKNIERYYYFSKPSNWDTDRPTFDIVYDQRGHFFRLLRYSDSGSATMLGCGPGLLPE